VRLKGKRERGRRKKEGERMTCRPHISVGPIIYFVCE
jgi:hypothetical protein